MAQRYADELRDELHEADIIVGFEEYGGLPRALAEPAPGPAGRVLVGGATVPFRDESRRGLRPRVLLLLLLHPRLPRPLPEQADAFLAEAEALAAGGALNLIAEDTNQYALECGPSRATTARRLALFHKRGLDKTPRCFFIRKKDMLAKSGAARGG